MRPFKDLAELERVVRRCHDILRIDKPHVMDAFDEFSKILLAKLQDELEVKQSIKSTHQFFAGFGETPEQIAQKLDKLFKVANKKYPEIFNDENSYLDIRYSTLSRIVELFSSYSLLDTSLDVKGATYEAFLSTSLPVGKVIGQFFTPMEILDFCIALVNPTIDDIVVDPACGSGGFLLTALRYVWMSLKTPTANRNVEKEKIDFISNHLYGVDIDPRMVRLARINILIHSNSLLLEFRSKSKVVAGNGLVDENSLSELKTRQATVAVTNPPFGSIEFDSIVLNLFQLGRDKKSRHSAVLFLERCLQLLGPKGRFAIVVPDSILGGASTADVRGFIRKKSTVKAVIKLPSETFMPYGSSAESSVLFLEKNEAEQGPVFMAIADAIGYNRLGEHTEQNDLQSILSFFEHFQKGVYVQNASPVVFICPKEQLGDRLDVRSYWHPGFDYVQRVLSKSRYPVFDLKDVVLFKHESINPSKDYPEIEFRFIGLGNVEPRTGRLVYGSEKTRRNRMISSNEKTKGKELKGLCQVIKPGEVIYGTLRPNLRKVHYLIDTGTPTLCSSEFIVMAPKKIIAGEYLACILRSNVVLNQLRHLYTGLGRPRISKRDVGNVRVPVPIDLRTQLALAHRISTLEDEAVKMKLEARNLLDRLENVLNESEQLLLKNLTSNFDDNEIE